MAASNGDEDAAMDDSRTEEDERWDPKVRREQRARIRSIIQDVQERREEIVMPDEFVKHVKEMNTVYRDIVAPREAALDAEGFKLLSTIGREQAEASAGELVFDPLVFCEKLVTIMGGRHRNELDWAKLGDKVAGCFQTVPSLSFMHGALDMEPLKTKRQAQRKKKESGEVQVEKPRELTDFEGEEETTTRDIAHLFIQLRKVCGEGGDGHVHYFRFLFHPTSFAQTVENMFHFSFLVKDGRASMWIDEEEHQPYISIPASGKSTKTKKNQAIMSLNMEQWRKAIEKFDIKTPMISPLSED